MRVVHVLRSLGAGGVEFHVQQVVRHLNKSGIDSHIVSLTGMEPGWSFEELKVPLHMLHDDMAWGRKSGVAACRLRRLIGHLKPEIVHVHGARPIAVGPVVSKTINFPGIVSTVHSSYKLAADGAKKGVRLWVARVSIAAGLAISDRVICVSRALVDDASEAASVLPEAVRRRIKQKAVVIHNGVALERFGRKEDRSESKLRLGIQPDCRIVGTVSRLDEPHKGISVLMRAFRRLQDCDGNLRLVVAGDGHSYRQLLRLGEELGIAGKCLFLGHREDTETVYSACDVFVLPSFSEGLPYTLLEAMIMGCPIVATATGGVPEIVDHNRNGFLVNPGDEEGLAGAVRRLLLDTGLLEATGAAARAKALLRFSEDEMLRQTASVYQGLMRS